jgi:hypothetical protein
MLYSPEVWLAIEDKGIDEGHAVLQYLFVYQCWFQEPYASVRLQSPELRYWECRSHVRTAAITEDFRGKGMEERSPVVQIQIFIWTSCSSFMLHHCSTQATLITSVLQTKGKGKHGE